MDEENNSANRPPAPPGAVPPRDADGESALLDKYRIVIEACQEPLGATAAAPPGEPPDPRGLPSNPGPLSRDEANTVCHALLGDVIAFLARNGVHAVVAERMGVASCKELLAAASKGHVSSVDAAVEILAKALHSRVVGLKVIPESHATNESTRAVATQIGVANPAVIKPQAAPATMVAPALQVPPTTRSRTTSST